MQRLEELAEIGAIVGADGDRGSARLALTAEDGQGRDLVVKWMRDLGLDISIDGVGNVIATMPHPSGLSPVMTGSHIDTVATVSIWEPVITGDNPDGCGIVAMTLPTPSIEMSRPRSRIHFTTRSRPWPSSAVRARRADPRSPSAPTIAPISASSSRRCNRRSPLTARFTPESLRTLLHFVKAFQLRDQFALTPIIAILARCHQGVPPRVPPPPCR